MTIHWQTVVVVLAMFLMTYFTRIAGYLFLRKRTLSPRVMAVLDNVPGCVLLSVIAPYFVVRSWADGVAIVVAVLAAMRFGLLLAVVIAVVCAGGLRHLS